MRTHPVRRWSDRARETEEGGRHPRAEIDRNDQRQEAVGQAEEEYKKAHRGEKSWRHHDDRLTEERAVAAANGSDG